MPLRLIELNRGDRAGKRRRSRQEVAAACSVRSTDVWLVVRFAATTMIVFSGVVIAAVAAVVVVGSAAVAAVVVGSVAVAAVVVGSVAVAVVVVGSVAVAVVVVGSVAVAAVVVGSVAVVAVVVGSVAVAAGAVGRRRRVWERSVGRLRGEALRVVEVFRFVAVP